MSNPQDAITNMKKTSDYLICIDSDGCVFDTMEIKHKECFIPNIINYWDLQAVSKYAREAAEYVNLYSKFRGINRFPALIKVIDLLSHRPEVLARGFKAPNIDSLRKWSETETKLGNPALIKYVEEHPEDEVMAKALRWSIAVNDDVTKIVHGVPPFPYVVDCFEKMKGKVDIVVVSATPVEALEREWAEHDVAKYVNVIAGQEMGVKKDCIALAKALGYDDDKVLMIGDAPGDLKAAKANNVLYFPINPGDEDASWKNLLEESFDCFINGTYKGAYEEELIKKFDSYLPSTPWWKTV